MFFKRFATLAPVFRCLAALICVCGVIVIAALPQAAAGRVTGSFDATGYRTLPQVAGEIAGPVEVTVYDGWGEMDTVRDFDGRTTKFAHDALGRMRSKETLDHPTRLLPFAAAKLEWDFDLEGRLTESRVRNGAGALLHTDAFPRDARGRIEAKESTFSAGPWAQRQIDYTWFDNGLLKSLQADGEARQRFAYDSANRLAGAWTRETPASPETLPLCQGSCHLNLKSL